MIESKVKQLIAKQLGVVENTIKPDSKLVSDLGADSLDLLEIVMLIEKAFQITVEEDEYATADTLEKIVQLIKSKTAD
jgi:acyl carrier protein